MSLFRVWCQFGSNPYASLTGLVNEKIYEVYAVSEHGNFLVYEPARQTAKAMPGESSARTAWTWQNAEYFVPIDGGLE